MRYRRMAGIGLAAIAALSTLALPGSPVAAAPAASRHASPVCATPAAGYAACFAEVLTEVAPSGTARMAAAAPTGYGPADLRGAYHLTTSGSATQTIAIVDAQDDPTAEADLNAYRGYYGLPACTSASGCFRKVNQTGGTSYPAVDASWALEISLDIEMASAICPGCHILLVEATSASLTNLATAVDEAAALGAKTISNSYGGSELLSWLFGVSSHYSHPGVAITASTGDNGYGVSFPASAPAVTAVGGTTLNWNGTTRTETAWNGAGSGCSSFFAQPSGQAGAGTGCSRHAVGDVSAVADPATGVAVYDTTAYNGQSGWFRVGGTSVSSPIIASVIALAGNAASYTNSYPYSHTGSLNDVTTGSNGTCSTSQWCNARAGWDGPTGLGTPNGTGAF
ncbi:S53 family peptidase [Rugosimonospora africana]|uniref:Peptidase S8 n=1 Tax=Rugosimonospora africana TaxID=556532 RepID=A0A8J3QWQ2_9ACTN|nr:S53 family peptidase [Rugosimonospora africana]GIH18273.1 peptidase S8 [Rugosimonospora africana]